jgi:hypothetical protein
MSTSRQYNGAVSWDLVSYAYGLTGRGYAIRSDAFEEDAYAFFGSASVEVVEARFHEWQAGRWGNLNFNDPDGHGEMIYVKALHRPGTTEPLAGEPLADDPLDRSAQHDAIMAMRRRESEARERAEREGRRADALQRELAQLRERLGQFAEALADEAERRDWCEEYDNFIEGWEDLGFSVRETDHDVQITVSMSFNVSVTAPHNVADLSAYVDKDTAIAWLQGAEYSQLDYAIDNVEA